jgi:hypothetical protein
VGFDCEPSFSSGEVLCRRARVPSEVERSEPKGNLDGFFARLHDSQQNEGRLKSGRKTYPVKKGWEQDSPGEQLLFSEGFQVVETAFEVFPDDSIHVHKNTHDLHDEKVRALHTPCDSC